MSANRIVVILSPIFVGLAAWLAAIVAKYLPGHPHLDPSQLVALMIAFATLAAGHVAIWLHGWQKTEPSTSRVRSR